VDWPHRDRRVNSKEGGGPCCARTAHRRDSVVPWSNRLADLDRHPAVCGP